MSMSSNDQDDNQFSCLAGEAQPTDEELKNFDVDSVFEELFNNIKNQVQQGESSQTEKGKEKTEIKPKKFTNTIQSPLVIGSDEEDNLILDDTIVEQLDTEVRSIKKTSRKEDGKITDVLESEGTSMKKIFFEGKVKKDMNFLDEGAVVDKHKKKTESLKDIDQLDANGDDWFAIKKHMLA
ncbi:hypothetical protein L1987_33279 [Smallanthus sonchifolius]|uniref:Uncharacterized protein n=1 Tax=Smallanthus sonchifolius TaxID=185202 RepID=A0ACB9HRF7_9ASTR|nr:hypothetical protein L1987_33279 [Smallanthus sonchifolius]